MTNGTDSSTMTLRSKVHFGAGDKGRLELKRGAAPAQAPTAAGRVPKVARLMALTIKFEGMLKAGEVTDYAELTRLGHVSRARLTQIMNLLNLAPDLQEALLFLPLVTEGREPVKEWRVRPVAAEVMWAKQRAKWRSLRG